MKQASEILKKFDQMEIYLKFRSCYDFGCSMQESKGIAGINLLY